VVQQREAAKEVVLALPRGVPACGPMAPCRRHILLAGSAGLLAARRAACGGSQRAGWRAAACHLTGCSLRTQDACSQPRRYSATAQLAYASPHRSADERETRQVQSAGGAVMPTHRGPVADGRHTRAAAAAAVACRCLRRRGGRQQRGGGGGGAGRAPGRRRQQRRRRRAEQQQQEWQQRGAEVPPAGRAVLRPVPVPRRAAAPRWCCGCSSLRGCWPQAARQACFLLPPDCLAAAGAPAVSGPSAPRLLLALITQLLQLLAAAAPCRSLTLRAACWAAERCMPQPAAAAAACCLRPYRASSMHARCCCCCSGGNARHCPSSATSC
jgi:hypothetical protein